MVSIMPAAEVKFVSSNAAIPFVSPSASASSMVIVDPTPDALAILSAPESELTEVTPDPEVDPEVNPETTPSDPVPDESVVSDPEVGN